MGVDVRGEALSNVIIVKLPFGLRRHAATSRYGSYAGSLYGTEFQPKTGKVA